MKRWQLMVVAGESSGDILGAELVSALQTILSQPPQPETHDRQPLHVSLQPRFFGAGGSCLAAAGMELELDLTVHAVIGLDVLKKYLQFRKIFQRLKSLALREQPDALLLIDFAGFNRRFAATIRRHVRSRQGTFNNWNPKIVQYVSPQVWASRARRAEQIARDYDLLLSIFPFEKEWYAQRTPQLRVAFVGHPMIDRHGFHGVRTGSPASPPLVVLLPGSRESELRRHVPILVAAARQIRAEIDVVFRMVLPSEALLQFLRANCPGAEEIPMQVGGLAEVLGQATVAIAATGTVTMECAYFGVPTVAIYVASWITHAIARRIVTVRYLAMPNLLAGEPLFPELLQSAATPENIAREALELLRDPKRRIKIKTRLEEVVASLGKPGASQRAAAEISQLLLAK